MKDSGNVYGRGGETEASATSTSLLERLKESNPAAWGELAQLYGPLVYEWCLHAGLGRQDAEDIVQEVFCVVAGKIAEFRYNRPGDTFRGWLWTITRNKIGNWLKRRGREPVAAGGTTALRQLNQVPASQLDDISEATGRDALFGRALSRIRPEFKERTWQAFWRVAIADHTPADVADELGVSVNAVYVAKSRVLCRLREVLGDPVEREGKL